MKVFSTGSIYEGTKRTFQYMPNKNLQQPSHSLSMYDIFNGENSKLSTLTISMLAQAALL